MVKEGKLGAIGLSEASVAEIGRAHALHPVASVQSELSHVAVIPGTKTRRYLEDNVEAGSLTLPPEALAELAALPEPVGAR
ncbi:hypothetical protein [Streptomyces sp. NPDC088707]|uniref:hypothetical protein n=1 Tax=Streptomyces sp. NPDC088707 TaxID=3365871 RepID=UPI003811C454